MVVVISDGIIIVKAVGAVRSGDGGGKRSISAQMVS